MEDDMLTDEEESQNAASWSKAIAIVLKMIGLLSIAGSSTVIYVTLFGDSGSGASTTRRRSNVQTGRTRSSINASSGKLTLFDHLLLALCAYDITSSFGFFLSTWAVPKEQPEGMQEMLANSINITKSDFDYDTYLPWASGNETTCNFQG